MTITITKTFADAAGDPVDPTSVTLSNQAGTAGVTAYAAGSVVVADGTPFANPTPGTYTASFDPPARNTLYAVTIETVYGGDTFYEMRIVRSEPHDGTEPIVEQLAQWWLAKLATITADGGFYQDIGTPRRPEDGFWSGLPTTDLSCELQLGPVDQLEESGRLDAYGWRQSFIVNIYLAGPGGGSDVTDTRIARLIHDIHSLVAAEIAASTDGTCCDGLADGLSVGAYAVEPVLDQQLTVVRVPILVDYSESITDPTMQ